MTTKETQPITFDRFVRAVALMAVLAALIWTVRYLADVLTPFALALVAAYLANPLAERIQRLGASRAVAVLATCLASLLAIIVCAAVAAPLISGEVAHMGALLSELLSNSDLAAKAAAHLPPDIWQALKDLAARPDVQELFKGGDALALARTVAAKALPGAWGVLRGAAGLVAGVAGIVVVVLYFVFLLQDFDNVRSGWLDMVPPARRCFVRSLADDFAAAMGRYFRAQALVAACVGVLFAVGFGLIGLPLGVLLGLAIGLMNMVPYLQLAGFVPAFFLGAIHALETGNGLWTTLALILAVFAVVQLIQDAVLTPRIMGQAMGLSPAVILLSLSVWGKLLGMLGLLLAIPLTCLAWAWYRRYVTGEEPGDIDPGAN